MIFSKHFSIVGIVFSEYIREYSQLATTQHSRQLTLQSQVHLLFQETVEYLFPEQNCNANPQ